MTRRAERLILHIGQHKTGTTSLQDSLARNRKRLEAAGILYPRLGPWGTAHHALTPAMLGGRLIAPYISLKLGPETERRSRQLFDDLKEAVEHSGCHTLVLSSEAFFRRLRPEEIANLGERLSELARTVEVVCYLRHPADLLLSAISTQLLRSPVLRRPGSMLQIGVVECYAQVAGVTLHVLPFAKGVLKGGDVVDDFAERFLPGGPGLLPERPRRPLNQTLSPEAMILAQEYGRREKARPEVRMTRRHQVFRELLRRLDPRVAGYARPRLKPGIADAVVRQAEGMDRLRKDWGCTIPGLDYAAAGTGSTLDFSAMQDVGDFCSHDPDRLRRLRRYVGWLMPRAP